MGILDGFLEWDEKWLQRSLLFVETQYKQFFSSRGATCLICENIAIPKQAAPLELVQYWVDFFYKHVAPPEHEHQHVFVHLHLKR